ncbi:hypothetical protein EMCRGX_G032660 [Ephydatia muelleri]
MIHVAPMSKIPTWYICTPNLNYTGNTDSLLPIYPTLIRTYRTLIYNGDVDGCVPYIGDEHNHPLARVTNVSVHATVNEVQAAFLFFALRQDSNILCSGSSRLTSDVGYGFPDLRSGGPPDYKHAASADNAGSGGGRNSVSAGMGRPPAHQAVQWLHRDRCNDGEVPPLLVS